MTAFPPVRTFRTLALLSALPVMVLAVACGLSSLPSLHEQKAQILNHDIRLRLVTRQAFREAWGPPTYELRQRTQFYPVKDGNLIPQFRVPLGETPDGWEPSVVSEEGFFFGYADRGELLGFIDDRLVYREQTSPEEIHAIGKAWEKNRLFRTRLEGDRP